MLLTVCRSISIGSELPITFERDGFAVVLAVLSALLSALTWLFAVS
jgi:hypothetical protein